MSNETPQFRDGDSAVAWRGFRPRRVIVLYVYDGGRVAKIREAGGHERTIATSQLTTDPGAPT